MIKKGELTSTQIITIVLLIIGFVILMLFVPVLQDLFGESEANREVCHLSVIARSQTAGTPLVGGSIPLKCQTEKVCLSESRRKDACEQFANEENIRPAKVNLDDPIRAQYDIEHEIAEAMRLCWQTMGEGKLNIFGGGFLEEKLTEKDAKCVICSRIAFDEKLWNDPEFESKIRKNIDVNKHMSERTPFPDDPNAPTYIELFENTDVALPGSATDSSESDQLAVIFSQIFTEEKPSFWFQLGGFLAYYKMSKSRLNSLEYCQDFVYQETEQGGKALEEKAKKGCSKLTVVNWDKNSLNEIRSKCPAGIESIP